MNVDPKESDLTPIPEEALSKIAAHETVSGTDGLRRWLAQSRGMVPLAPVLLGLLAVLFVAESVLSNLAARHRSQGDDTHIQDRAVEPATGGQSVPPGGAGGDREESGGRGDGNDGGGQMNPGGPRRTGGGTIPGWTATSGCHRDGWRRSRLALRSGESGRCAAGRTHGARRSPSTREWREHHRELLPGRGCRWNDPGAMNDLLFHPVVPWALLLLLIAAGAGLIGWSLVAGLRSTRRRLGLAALRLVALAALAFALIQPQVQREEVTIVRPQVAVLVDNSLSMTDPVDDTQPHRADRVGEFLRSPAAAEARKSFDLRVFTLDGTELSADKGQLAFTGNASNVVTGVSALEEHFRGQPLAAVLLLTDGLDTSGVGKPEGVSYGVPVDTFELEKPFTPKPRAQRVSIAGADYPPRVVVGWHSDVRVSLAGSGMNGQTVPVELWRDGKKVGDATTAFSEDEQTRPVSFAVTHERAGVEQYEVRVADAAADREARAYPFSINVQEPGKRVLYLQNQLTFDFKFLRKAIAANRNLQLNSFTRWADGRLINLDDRGGGPPAALDLSRRHWRATRW